MVRNPTQTDLAYAAGLIDGEGSIMRHGTGIRLCVAMCDKPVLRWLHEFMGGALYDKKVAPGRSPQLRLEISRQSDLHDALLAMMPYLRVKRRQAELACAWLDQAKRTRDSTDPRRRAAWDAMVDMNSPMWYGS